MHPRWYFLAVENAQRATVERVLTHNRFRFEVNEGGFAVFSRNPIPLSQWLAKQGFRTRLSDLSPVMQKAA